MSRGGNQQILQAASANGEHVTDFTQSCAVLRKARESQSKVGVLCLWTIMIDHCFTP